MTFFGSYSYDGVSVGIWVIHRGGKSGCKLVTLFGGYSYDVVSAGIGVIHTGAKSGCELVTLLSCLWYDKLWGPSQRVVTLLYDYRMLDLICAKYVAHSFGSGDSVDQCDESAFSTRPLCFCLLVRSLCLH